MRNVKLTNEQYKALTEISTPPKYWKDLYQKQAKVFIDTVTKVINQANHPDGPSTKETLVMALVKALNEFRIHSSSVIQNTKALPHSPRTRTNRSK